MTHTYHCLANIFMVFLCPWLATMPLRLSVLDHRFCTPVCFPYAVCICMYVCMYLASLLLHSHLLSLRCLYMYVCVCILNHSFCATVCFPYTMLICMYVCACILNHWFCTLVCFHYAVCICMHVCVCVCILNHCFCTASCPLDFVYVNLLEALFLYSIFLTLQYDNTYICILYY